MFAQVHIEVPDELYDRFRETVLLFVVQEIPDCNMPLEMKMHKEENRQKNKERNKKVIRCRHETEKDPFVHTYDRLVSALWFDAYSS